MIDQEQLFLLQAEENARLLREYQEWIDREIDDLITKILNEPPRSNFTPTQQIPIRTLPSNG